MGEFPPGVNIGRIYVGRYRKCHSDKGLNLAKKIIIKKNYTITI